MAKSQQKNQQQDDVAQASSQVGTDPSDSDYDDYIADMILELQQMAARAGRHALAERLLAAHELARHR